MDDQGWSHPCFQDQVERRFGGAPEVREARLAKHVAQPLGAGLRTEHELAALGNGVRAADQRRAGVVQAAHRRQVVFDLVAFKRRFTAATGIAPIAYIQRLRIEDAKRRLERTDASVDEISWRVGYEDAAFFRRLFRRITGMAPGAYRKRFRIPEFARP